MDINNMLNLLEIINFNTKLIKIKKRDIIQYNLLKLSQFHVTIRKYSMNK